jgi:porin
MACVLMSGPIASGRQDDAGAASSAAEQEEAGIDAPTPDPREASELDDPDSFLLGREASWRSDLARQGLTFDIQWTQSFQSVVDGGRDTGFAYGGSLDYVLNLDLDRMDVVPGAFVGVMAESRYGESVNGDSGSLLPVNTDLGFPLTDEPDDNIAITVTELTYTQFLSEQFGFILGKIQTLDGDLNEFASGRGRSQFSSAGFIFNPVTALAVPYSTLGGGVVWLPSKTIAITSVVVNTADSSTTTGFGDFGDGWTWSTEAQFQYRLGGLPGGQVVGFMYAGDGEFTNFNRVDLLPEGLFVGTEDDSWAVTWSAWQYIYTPDEVPDLIDTGDGRADLRGLGLFARVGIADDDTNPIDLSIGGGIGGRGLLPGREGDTFGIGLTYVDFDTQALLSAIGFDDDGYGFEAFYNFDLGHGLSLTGSAQVLDPVASRVGTTTVLGARFNVRF